MDAGRIFIRKSPMAVNKYKRKYLRHAAYWFIFTLLGLIIAERLTYMERGLFIMVRSHKVQDGRNIIESNLETGKRRMIIIRKGSLPTEISMGDGEEADE